MNINKEEPLTADHVRELLTYIPESGLLIWNARPIEYFKTKREFLRWNTRYCNKVAGTLKLTGYINVKIKHGPKNKRKSYMAHRVIWLLVTGSWPPKGFEIDHIDGCRSNNRFKNLRLVTRSENQQNRKPMKNTTSKYTGVHWCSKNKKWMARIIINRKYIHLGQFDYENEANASYLAAKKVYHPSAPAHHYY